MNLGRVFVVCKSFWPVSGETELLATSFVERLQRIVPDVDVLTWRMIRQWPDQFSYGKCRVLRLPGNQRTSWTPASLGYGRNRWHRALQRWLANEANNYDAGIIFEYPGDQWAPTMIASRHDLPVISRVSRRILSEVPRNLSKHSRWCESHGIRLVTADSAMLMDPLAASDGALGDLQVVPDGYKAPIGPVPEKQTARQILARVHPIFSLESQAILVVCGSELSYASGVFGLVRAWRRVLSQQRDAKLWLIGNGKNAPELYQRVCDLDLQHSVLLTGNFDDVTDVFAAADAYVIPGQEPASWYSSLASHLGLTTIIPESCQLSGSESRSRRIPFDEENRTIDRVLSNWATSRVGNLSHSNPPRDNNHGFGNELMDGMVHAYLDLLSGSVPVEQVDFPDIN